MATKSAKGTNPLFQIYAIRPDYSPFPNCVQVCPHNANFGGITKKIIIFCNSADIS